MRTHRWKYIRRYSDYKHPILANCDDGPSKSYWVENGWGKQTVASDALFDLVFDPNERNNLVADPSYREVLEEMRGRLHKWMVATDDPLLKGPVPAPHGARVTPPDKLSAEEGVITVP